MTEQDDTKLWQLLGKASACTPPADFRSKLMMRIKAEEWEAPVESTAVCAIPFFKRPFFRIWTGAMAAAIVVVAIVVSMMPPEQNVEAQEIAAVNIDDLLVQEAAMTLGEENLMQALCSMSASETGAISSDSIQEYLL